MVFKNKKYFWLTALMILMIFVSASCKKEEEVIKESKEQTESTDDKKENKKEVGSKKKKNTVSKKPHIILEEVHDGNFDMENYRYLYTMSSVHFNLREEDKEFEALRNALNEYNDMVDIRFKEIKEELEEYSQNDKDSEYPATTRYIETKSYVMRADEDIVSILNYEIEEQGIRHPIETRTSYNFDTKTGEQIELKDIVKDREAFLNLLDEMSEKDYKELEITKPSTYLNDFNQGDFTGLTWTANAEGVTLYFDTYTLGNYEEGTQMITVYFDDAKDIFEPKYISKEKDYVFPILHSDMTLRLDVDNDGERDMVYVNNTYEEPDETGEKYTVGSVVVRGVDMLEFEGFGSESYIVKKDGKYYMYHFMAEEGDINILYKIDLDTLNKNEKEYRLLSLSRNSLYKENEEDGGSYKILEETLTDPDSFIMETTFDLLSTVTGEREWSIGKNGYPREKDDAYKITDRVVLRTKSDISCKEVDTDGNIKGDAIIPAESYILFIKSDAKEYMDVRIIDKKYVEDKEWDGMDNKYFLLKDYTLLDYDGDCYRISVDFGDNEWMGTVYGVDIEELFEGILFVG